MTAGGTVVDGEEAARQIAGAISRFPEAISYVRAEVLPTSTSISAEVVPSEGAWLSCHELVGNREWLLAVIRATGRELGTDDDVVAASLFVQNYAYRVLMVPVACMVLAGVIPDARAEAMAITLARGRPHVVGYVAPSALFIEVPGDVRQRLEDPAILREAFDYLYERAIEAHLRRLIEVAHRCVRVGARLLWGNVAASAAVAFRTMDGCVGPWVQQIGERFFDSGPDVLSGLGSFFTLECGERRGWYWERTNCCLYDRLPGKVRCADCSRTPIDERRAAYRRSLEGGG